MDAAASPWAEVVDSGGSGTTVGAVGGEGDCAASAALSPLALDCATEGPWLFLSAASLSAFVHAAVLLASVPSLRSESVFCPH